MCIVTKLTADPATIVGVWRCFQGFLAIQPIIDSMSTQLNAECKVIRSDELEVEVSSGQMTRLAGVSKSLTGAEGIHLAIATIPPESSSSPHYHVNCESAIYVVKGTGRFLIGQNLEESLPIGPGDFIYVPPNAVHQPINDSRTDDLELIVARNAPVEIVVEYEPATNTTD